MCLWLILTGGLVLLSIISYQQYHVRHKLSFIQIPFLFLSSKHIWFYLDESIRCWHFLNQDILFVLFKIFFYKIPQLYYYIIKVIEKNINLSVLPSITKIILRIFFSNYKYRLIKVEEYIKQGII